jgi:hypothetical protein
MPESANVFVRRKENFFKANSKVQQAQGFDVNSMAATVGFISKTDKLDTAVEDLEQQEDGGDISGRAFIPLAQDRIGNTWTGNVKAAGRWRKVRDKITDSANSAAKNDAGKFFSSAKFAGVGGLVIGTKVTAKGNRLVWKIKKLGKGKVEKEALFAVKAGRKVEPKPTHFMRAASLKSAAKMEKYFVELGEARIAKLSVR